MNINNYNELLEYLYNNQDNNYKLFQQKLLKNNKIKVIGVRTPILKALAKQNSKNYEQFKNNTYNTYEETTIHGLTLGYLKIEFKELLKELDKFTKYINNWSTCDLTVANLKQFKKNQKQGFEYVKKCIKNKNIWKQRVGVVLINSYYINENYIDEILELLSKIKTDEYYLQMAIAWALSTCYIKYPNKTINIIKEKKLDKIIHNKTIQKIIESKKINKNEKELLKTYKINKD